MLEASNNNALDNDATAGGRRRFGYVGLRESILNDTAAASVGSGTATAWSLVIGAGFCLLVLNACIFFGIYYQRDKIKTRARLLQKHCVLRAVNAGVFLELLLQFF
jgi:hypothetical protein